MKKYKRLPPKPSGPNEEPRYDELVSALGDLLSMEDCVCIEAELEDGTCSVCTYKKMLERVPRHMRDL